MHRRLAHHSPEDEPELTVSSPWGVGPPLAPLEVVSPSMEVGSQHACGVVEGCCWKPCVTVAPLWLLGPLLSMSPVVGAGVGKEKGRGDDDRVDGVDVSGVGLVVAPRARYSSCSPMP